MEGKEKKKKKKNLTHTLRLTQITHSDVMQSTVCACCHKSDGSSAAVQSHSCRVGMQLYSEWEGGKLNKLSGKQKSKKKNIGVISVSASWSGIISGEKIVKSLAAV